MSKDGAISFAQSINQALDEAMAASDKVMIFGEDIADAQGGGVFKATSGLSTKYGTGRVRTTPIAEQAIMGAAIGAAIAGYRPVAEIMFMNFLTVCMDQLVNHAAKLRFMSGGKTFVPITVRCTTGAGVGFGGQHSDMLEAWFAHVPGMKVVTASNPAEAKGLLLSAIEDDDPTLFIEDIMMYAQKGEPLAAGEKIPLGKARVRREGSDVTVITYGRPVAQMDKLAEELAGEGISAEVIDLRTIAPFDEDTVLNSVAKTGRAVIVHEAIKSFGVGAEISSRIHEELFADLKAPVKRVGSKYCPVPFSPPLEQAFLYSQDEVYASIRRMMG
ncbi:pyruvate dehydrogenase [Sphingopyxis sp. Root214]|uniref:alpha-ketoacid dehydrogenase subunit beta n=1 Tax=unclassified Sphingopyxis TaxID=2614943 RepID=UPI0006F505E0|nr:MULTISPECIES: alpha-ketoacid dehydrogenase subunit beta [unclassified Sphingopyxis]KQZ73760.1 pyruvate dehydrogenase [Sphingopyxis sp. Root154]KRC07901.1 pyruvate dehydrogenase [Sphingopyxis sp. Root214]